MRYSFSAFGHDNIQGKHKTTLEFTKDKDVSLKGDCIIGVNADFDPKILRKAMRNKGRMIVSIKSGILEDKVSAAVNPGFKDENEMVIRKTDFASERTLGIKADKGSFDLNRGLLKHLKSKEAKISVEIEFLN